MSVRYFHYFRLRWIPHSHAPSWSSTLAFLDDLVTHSMPKTRYLSTIAASGMLVAPCAGCRVRARASDHHPAMNNGCEGRP